MELPSSMRVSIMPGQTSFTRILFCERSNAVFFTKALIAPLEVEYSTFPYPPICVPLMEHVKTILPPVVIFLFFSNFCVNKIGAIVLISSTFSSFPRFINCVGRISVMPALLTRPYKACPFVLHWSNLQQ